MKSDREEHIAPGHKQRRSGERSFPVHLFWQRGGSQYIPFAPGPWGQEGGLCFYRGPVKPRLSLPGTLLQGNRLRLVSMFSVPLGYRKKGGNQHQEVEKGPPGFLSTRGGNLLNNSLMVMKTGSNWQMILFSFILMIYLKIKKSNSNQNSCINLQNLEYELEENI